MRSSGNGERELLLPTDNSDPSGEPSHRLLRGLVNRPVTDVGLSSTLLVSVGRPDASQSVIIEPPMPVETSYFEAQSDVEPLKLATDTVEVEVELDPTEVEVLAESKSKLLVVVSEEVSRFQLPGPVNGISIQLPIPVDGIDSSNVEVLMPSDELDVLCGLSLSPLAELKPIADVVIETWAVLEPVTPEANVGKPLEFEALMAAVDTEVQPNSELRGPVAVFDPSVSTADAPAAVV